MYVTSGFWITFISPCPAPVHSGEPRGPMRQYVPIIFPHTPFHSLALDRDPSPSSLSADHGLHRGYHLLSSNRPCVRAHTRVMNLSVRVRVHKRAIADSGIVTRFLTMVTALPVIDLPQLANAITPAGRFISERCLGHDSKVLIQRFRGIPTMEQCRISEEETHR